MSPSFHLLITVLAIFGHTSGQNCGKPLSANRLSSKIVGGYDVGYYKYPWFAALLLDGSPWCGGTLISTSIVVTAAHCFRDYMSQNGTKLEDVYTIKLGVYNSCKKESTQKEFKTAKVQVHENYLKKQPYCDIALITLDKTANGFEPACLPHTALQDDTRGKEGFIIGLGTTKYGAENYPCQLNEGRVLIYPDQTCKSMIRNATTDKGDYPIKDAFCAGYMEGGVDACQGDSGGPLLITIGNSYYVLGLTSFGYDCAKPKLLGIYTDVSHYLDWIAQKTGIRAETTTASSENDTLATETEQSDEEVTDPVTTEVVQSIDVTQNNPTTVAPVNSVAPLKNSSSVIYFPIDALLMYPPKRIIIEFKKKLAKRKHPKKGTGGSKKKSQWYRRRHHKNN